jgi:hypothetical protein
MRIPGNASESLCPAAIEGKSDETTNAAAAPIQRQ